MQDHEVMLEFRDNRPELMRRLRKDYSLPDDKVINAMSEATISMVERGCIEADPIQEKYSDLICSWCGLLHYNAKCRERLKKHEKE